MLCIEEDEEEEELSVLFKSGRSSSACEAMMKTVAKPGFKKLSQLHSQTHIFKHDKSQ